MKKIKIGIAEDQHLFRKSLIALLTSEHQIQVIAEAGDGASYLNMLGNSDQHPDISLVDLNLPGLNGFDLMKSLQENYPKSQVIILSVHDQEYSIAKAIGMGASAFLSKTCDAEELFTAIFKVYEEGIYLTPTILRSVMTASRQQGTATGFTNIPVKLTRREREVLTLLCEELSNAEIAEKLHLSIRTVEGHRISLLQKTGCKSATGLALFAVRHNLIHILR